MVTKKHSPSREDLDLGITVATEFGLVSKWNRQGLPLEAFMDVRLPLVHGTSKMTFEQLFWGLIIYCVISVASFLAFGREILASTLGGHRALGQSRSIPQYVLHHK